MTELLWQAARREAASINGCRCPTTTDDLLAIADVLEAYVYFRSFELDLSGFIVKEEYKHAEIFVNSELATTVQRFTLAHQIGHLLDRKNLANDDEYSFICRFGGDYDLHEFFADEFAYSLLMPAQPFLRIFSQDNEYVAAKYFETSYQAVMAWKKRLDKHSPSPRGRRR